MSYLSETRATILRDLREVWADACALYNLRGPVAECPPSRFDLRGGTAGAVWFQSRPGSRRGHRTDVSSLRFRWNAAFAEHVGPAEYRATVAHEVAHAVRLLLAGDATHGVMWQRTCVALGGTGDRTHGHNEASAAAGAKRFQVKCGCSAGVYVGPVQIKRLRAGLMRYRCRKCGETVREA